jgi:hypothetical protein
MGVVDSWLPSTDERCCLLNGVFEDALVDIIMISVN